jgi:general secretion pathway protein I
MKPKGFSLIEVLVALAILALTLITAAQTGGSWIRNADRQLQTQLAQICAENAQIALRLSAQMPSIGERIQDCVQGNRTFRVTIITRPTPNPSFRRIQTQVSEGDTPILSFNSVLGAY